MFIDTHAHLTDKRFDTDRSDALARASGAGVKRIIEVGCSTGEWQEVLAFCRNNANVSCVLGIHPQNAKEGTDEALAELEKLCAENPAVVGIGETGLDYHYENAPRDVQKNVFLRHIALAKKLGLPLVVHCREAYPDFLALLDTLPDREFRGVVHCFAGTVEEAGVLLSKGFLLGIDGPVTYPNGEGLRRVVASTSLDKLLLETDSPYLAPQAYRGKRNEPGYVPLIAEEIARIKGADVETVAAVTTASAKILFGL